MSNEPIQSAASAAALEALDAAGIAASHARVQVRMMQAEMRRLRKAVKDAEAAEHAALLAYEATPYCDEIAA